MMYSIERDTADTANSLPRSPNGRTLRALGNLALAAIAVPLAYSLAEPFRIVMRHYEVPMADLPAEADGLRIAHLSDLHCSAITPVSLVDRIVELTNEAAPDLVALTGDYVSRRNSYLPFTGARLWAKPVMHYAEQVAASLGRLRPPEGLVAVPGNHDHSKGRCDAIMGLLARAGIRPLVNANLRVRGLAVAGLDDLRAGRPKLDMALAGISKYEAQLVLSHNPRVLSLLADRNCLILAGHTHAGQVHLPLTSFRRIPHDMRGTALEGGWYSDDRARLFVSAGLGSVHFPMRFRCPPEIVILTLRSI